jgi:amino acid transporter
MPNTIKNFFLGRPLSFQEMSHEKLGKIQALAVYSSDALSSVAYATEAILFELAVVGGMAMDWSLPVTLAICGLLLILLISYRQTIHEYPNGGGAYIVAKANLGEIPGLVAGGALLLDYLLTVSVSVSAGILAITSALPSLNQYKVVLCLVAIWLIVLGNLRGLRESGKIFAVPTYVFVSSVFLMIGVGAYQAVTGTLTVTPVSQALTFQYPSIGIFLILKAFSAGCTALTGVEAVSNGVPAFRKPESENAIITLIWMVVVLAIMFIGISILAHLIHVQPSENETVISQINRHIFGTGFIYYTIQISTMGILVLAANTAFADFPRLCSLLADDRYLPRQLASLGDRLVFSNGILLLAFFASILIILYHGDTNALLPLYAVGVFISFTLSQTGMVVKFWKNKPKGWHHHLAINATGAVVTTTVLVVISITRFAHGAWIILVLVPLNVLIFKKIKKHYYDLSPQLITKPEEFADCSQPLDVVVLIPVSNMHRGMIRAFRFARSISKDVIAVTVDINPETTKRLTDAWDGYQTGIPLVVLASPFRSMSEPLLEFVSSKIEETRSQKREVMLLIPEFVTARWWHNFLHNQTAVIIRTYIWLRYPELVVTSVRHRLKY